MSRKMSQLPRLYSEFAEWWPLLSHPDDYAEEAAFYAKIILTSSRSLPKTVLELGSGGGNNASHLKRSFALTLVDISPKMLAVSQKLNPECEHVHGDMRSIRLNRIFDIVFVHDAIMYMDSEDELRNVIKTAWVHCKPGGIALFVPDHTRENFKPATSHGGHNNGLKGLRYLEWTWDPDPRDNTYYVDFAYLLRSEDMSLNCVYDRHTLGIFSRDEWLQWIADAGFEPKSLQFKISEFISDPHEIFLGIKPM
jgi:SAM-dependent methyltransferase